MISLIVLALIVEVGLPVALYLMRDRVIFLPSTQPSPKTGLQFTRGAVDIEILQIRRPDGQVLAAYDARPRPEQSTVRGDVADPDVPTERPVMIFFHGNAGNIGMRAPLLESFVLQTGIRTILPDYTGYGGNKGTPTEQEAYRDGLAVYDHFSAAGVSPNRIVLYGESLGGAVALVVAAKRPSAGLILQSTFSSVSSMTRRLYPWLPLSALLTRNLFPSVDRISGLEIPLLIAHGTKDLIIPISEGKKLHGAAPAHAEFLAIDRAGHNNFFEIAGPEFFGVIASRVEAWTSGPKQKVDSTMP
jgi:pimeloyl-ACP methyl ester carboxylesterase